MITFDILTLFPEMLEGVINSSIIKRAIESGKIKVNLINFREFSKNKHQQVDDYAYGGGAGMLISVVPIYDALINIDGYQKAHKIITSPSGRTFNQKVAEELAEHDHIIIICGHYEGIDERIYHYVDDDISIGDYVLTGGEIPAMTILDAVARLVPDVIASDSIKNESFTMGLLEYPQYTRPAVFNDLAVPEVLLSGHHENIRKYQRYEALKKTYLKRPDLLEKAELSEEDLKMLAEIKGERWTKSKK
jgi:tRNA (guanine37-N1)-methyltransferase